MPAAPLPEPALPARSRIPASTGAALRVEIVVASGDNPLRTLTQYLFVRDLRVPERSALCGAAVDRT